MRAILPILVLLSLVPVAPAQGDGVTIGLVSARSLGCSPDSFTQPDLRVRVLVNGATVLETLQASDQKEPLFAQAVVTTAALPFTLAVEVEEAEPRGFAGETFVPCDVQPGDGERYQTQVSTAGTRTILARGDGPNAAEAVLVVGRDPPPVPALSVTSLRTDSAVVSWPPVDASIRHTLAWGGVGPALASVTKGDSSIPMTGLCDDTNYTVRVVRDADPWRVSSADLTFRTLNVAPLAPVVTHAERRNDTVDVGWAGVPRDAREIEIFAGPPGFFAATSSFVQVVELTPGFAPDTGSRTFVVPESAAEIRIKVTDAGGLTATSASFAFNAPPNPAPQPPSCAPPRAIVASSAPAAQPTPGLPTGAVPGAIATETDGAAALPGWAWGLAGLVAGGAVVAVAMRRR